jgi:hypothetical protein
MEVEAGVLGQPGPDVGVVVGAVVVKDHVHGEAFGHIPVDLFQEVQELVVGVVGQALADDDAAECAGPGPGPAEAVYLCCNCSGSPRAGRAIIHH